MNINVAQLYIKYEEIINVNGYTSAIEYDLVLKDDIKNFIIAFKDNIIVEIINDNDLATGKICNYIELYIDDILILALLKLINVKRAENIEFRSEIINLKTIIEEQDIKIKRLDDTIHTFYNETIGEILLIKDKIYS